MRELQYSYLLSSLMALAALRRLDTRSVSVTATADGPEADEPVIAQSRQVRRFLARKGPRRQTSDYLLGYLGGRSKYMPHIGAKERGRRA